MNKTQQIDAVASKSALSRAQAERSLKAILEIISEELGKGGSVSLLGFGKFETRMRKARTGRNPRTGAPIAIAASRMPAFSPGANLRRSVEPPAE